jgi:hypothetical protein
MDEKHPILFKPIRELPLSHEFIGMATINHFEILAQMVAVPVAELEKLPGFRQRLLGELIGILLKYGLENMLKEH